MKKLFTFLFFCTLCTSALLAQDDETSSNFPEKGDKEFSIQVGLNSATFTDNDGDRGDEASGALLGAKASFYWSNRWSFTTGAYYDQKGTSFGAINETFRLNYLTVPLNADWHFGRNRRWNLNFGLNAGIFLSGSSAGVSIEDGINSLDLGIQLGIGHKIPVGDNYIQISLDGVGGLLEVFESSDAPTTRNNRSALAVGFIF